MNHSNAPPLAVGSFYFETLLARFEIMQKIRPASKSRFGSVCARLFGTANTQFIHNLTGNTQLTKSNVRYITKSVNPKKLAAWMFGALYERLCEYAYEVYDTIEHPALGQSPREAFAAAQAYSGQRSQRFVSYNEEFEMLTLPTTAKGSAKVVTGRGVKINHIYYWCDGFRDASVEQTKAPVRYEPFNLGRAYAYVRGQWRQCVSEHYLAFCDRSERELMIAAAELRRRHQQHGQRFNLTARKLAAFLTAVGTQEQVLLQQQRRRDAEARRLHSVNAGAATNPAAGDLPAPASAHALYSPTNVSQTPVESEDSESYRWAGDDSSPDFSSLELYGDY